MEKVGNLLAWQLPFLIGVLALLLTWRYCENRTVEEKEYELLPDSVAQQLRKEYTTVAKIKILLALAGEDRKSDLSTKMNAARIAQKLAEKSVDKFGLAKSHYHLGRMRIRGRRTHSELNHLNISIKLFKELDDPTFLTRAYNSKASFYLGNNQSIEAQDALDSSLINLQKVKGHNHDSLKMAAELLNTQARLEFLLKEDTIKARVLFKNTLRIYEKINEPNNMASNWLLLLRVSEPSEARKLFEQALAFYKSSRDSAGISNAWTTLGIYYKGLDNDSKKKDKISWLYKSITCFRTALEFNSDFQSANFNRIGEAYLQLVDYLKDTNLRKAKVLADSANQHFLAALRLTAEELDTARLKSTIKNLSKTCYIFQNCDTALVEASKTYRAIIDSSKVFQEREEMAIKSTNELENELEAGKRKDLMASTVFIFFILITIGIVRAQRLKIKHQKREIIYKNQTIESRLKALRAQMNPHFISNILNSIDGLINTGSSKEASQFIILFSRLCREILDQSNERYISLDRELETQDRYLKLEKLRLKENLSISLKIDKSLDPKIIDIPPMILNPFLENAIIHGIHKKQAPGHLKIVVQAVDEDKVKYIIEDDGLGRENVSKLAEESVLKFPSHGIEMTRERIEKEKEGQLQIIDLKDEDGNAAGTRVVITLPRKRGGYE